MPEAVAEEAAPGVRAATHVPRTWRAYLAVRPEMAALFALALVVAALGFAAHRSLYFQVSEVVCVRACVCACVRVREKPLYILFVPRLLIALCTSASRSAARLRSPSAPRPLLARSFCLHLLMKRLLTSPRDLRCLGGSPCQAWLSTPAFSSTAARSAATSKIGTCRRSAEPRPRAPPKTAMITPSRAAMR
jgi:hypothetical protein